jgi:hypothetical protein
MLYKSVFDESSNKRKMNEALVFSISTVEDAYEAMQKCVSLVIEKKRGGLVVVIGRIAEAVMNGIKDALSNFDPNKAETLKKQIVAKFITFFKKDAMNTPEEPRM